MIFLLKYFKTGVLVWTAWRVWSRVDLWGWSDHVIVVLLGRGPKIEPEVDKSLQKLSDRDRNIFTHNYLYVTISSFNIVFENEQLISMSHQHELSINSMILHADFKAICCSPVRLKAVHFGRSFTSVLLFLETVRYKSFRPVTLDLTQSFKV